MTPFDGIVSHRPPHSYGDCLRASIASILDVNDIEDVPHFFRHGDNERAHKELREYLSVHRLRPFIIAFPAASVSLDDVFVMMAENNPDIEYLLFCQCGTGNHVVICRNGEMIHNTGWDNAPITGPCEDGLWVVMVLVRA